MKRSFLKLLALTCLSFTQGYAAYYEDCSNSPDVVWCDDLCQTFPHQVSIQPLVGKSTVKDMKHKHSGCVTGVKLTYDYIAPFKPYFGAEIGNLTGDLRKKSCHDHRVDAVENMNQEQLFQALEHGTIDQGLYTHESKKMKYDQTWLEGKVGATFGEESDYLVTPFFLVGCEKEKQDYKKCAFKLKNTRHFSYVGAGFLSKVFLKDFSAGLNFKFRYLTHCKNNSHCADFHDTHSAGGHFHYQLELPLTYAFHRGFEIGVVPFYQYEKYGRHEFDWQDTCNQTIHIWGSTLKLAYNF